MELPFDRIKEDQRDAGLRELDDVYKEMLEMGVHFKDASLEERLIPAIKSALECNASCRVNPYHTIIKIRDSFRLLAQDEEITKDESAKITARMMRVAGEDFSSRKALIDKFMAGDLSALRL